MNQTTTLTIITIAAIALTFLSSSCDAKRMMPPKGCMDKHRQAYATCIKDPRTNYQNCQAALEQAMKMKCRKDPSKYLRYEIETVLNHLLDQCMMKPLARIAGAYAQRKDECMKEREALLRTIHQKDIVTTQTTGTKDTATKAPEPTTAKAKREMERQFMTRSAKAMTELFRECMSTADRSNPAARKHCEIEAKNAFENFNGKQPTEQKFKEELKKGLVEKTGDYLGECIRNATTPQERNECFHSTTIKDACTSMRDDDKECDASDLKESARKKATNDIKGLIEACMNSASNEQEKRTCRNSQLNEFKKVVSELENRDDVKENEIYRKIKEGNREDISSLMEICLEEQEDDNDDDTSAEEKRKDCMEQIRERIANARGANVTNVKDHQLKREVEVSFEEKLREKMKVCMEMAGSDLNKVKNCTQHVARIAVHNKKMMEKGREAGKTGPTKTEIASYLKRGGEREAVNSRKACEGDKKMCDEFVKRNVAQALGKRENELTNFALKEIEKKGSINSVIEDAKACAEARREKNDASCTAAYDRYKTMRGNEKQEAETKEAVNKEKMVREALIEAQKEIISTCLNFDVEQRGTCMNEAQEEFVEYAKILHPPLEQMEDKLKLQIQRNAVHSIIYDFVKNCMENSESNDEKEQCKLQSKKQTMELEGFLNERSETDVEEVMKKGHSKLLSKVDDVCNDVEEDQEMIQCRKEAKENAIKAGLKAREYSNAKNAAVIKGTAEIVVACMDSGKQNEECDMIAKETFKRISGAKKEYYYQKQYPHEKATVQQKVWKMAAILKAGNRTKLFYKNKVILTVQTNKANCNEKVGSDLSDKTLEYAKDVNVDISKAPKMHCHEIDNKAEYTAVLKLASSTDGKNMEKEEVLHISDELAMKAKAFKSNEERRRLQGTEAVETYAGQESVECVETDTECISDDEDDNDATTDPTATDCENGSCCGSGTALRNGKCVPTYAGMRAACEAARGERWGWTCSGDGIQCDN